VELNWCSAHRMAECQSGGVECLAWGGASNPLGCVTCGAADAPAPSAAVHWIAHDRVSYVLQMNPDLVSPAGVQLEPQEVDAFELRNHLGVGTGCSSFGRHYHPFAVAGVTSNRLIDSEDPAVQVTPGERGIGPSHPPSSDGGSQTTVGQVGLRHQHQPRGIAIQPVHDARASFGPTSQRRAASDQRVDQRIVPMTWSGMHHQSGRLIDNREVLVLEHDGERKSPWLNGSWRFLVGNANGDPIAAGQQSRSSSGLPGDTDQLVSDQAGGLGPRNSQLICEKTIESFGLVG